MLTNFNCKTRMLTNFFELHELAKINSCNSSPFVKISAHYFFAVYAFIMASNVLNLSSHILRNGSIKSAICFIFFALM